MSGTKHKAPPFPVPLRQAQPEADGKGAEHSSEARQEKNGRLKRPSRIGHAARFPHVEQRSHTGHHTEQSGQSGLKDERSTGPNAQIKPHPTRKPRTAAGNAARTAAALGLPAAYPDGQPRFIPMSAEEMQALGWKELDVLLICGDAYVDHPSFGCVLLARLLISRGYKTGLIAQPRWDTVDDFLVMGRPRLFAGVSAGALDSMLAHYTAFRKKRRDDAYTPGGAAGARPNRACLVYANLARRAFPGLPLVLGGIEASLRRAVHYDFWTDALRRPILMDAKADVLVCGMGERAVLECARRLDQGRDIRGIAGTAWLGKLGPDKRPADLPPEAAGRPLTALPSLESITADPFQLVTLTRELEQQVHNGDTWAFEPVGDRALVLAPPAAPLSESEMDSLYQLPFCRKAHPSYTAPIPAEEMLRTSITGHRGCGGGCSFCSLALHQGRRISSRSESSITEEVRGLARAAADAGKGPVAVSDIGGPTANMWQGHCALEALPGQSGRADFAGIAVPAAERNCGQDAGQNTGQDAKADLQPGKGRCRRTSCCFPTVCKSFITPQRRHIALLRAAAAVPHVKQVRVASGVRADLALREPEALAAYTGEFTGGQLKVAPEHFVDAVLRLMRKPPVAVFEAFLESFVRQSRAAGREQYVVPYLMSAFPGCTDEDMYELSRRLRLRHWNPRQTQCFIPTPGSMATAMFYCGRDESGQSITVARTDAARLRQHRILMPVSERSEAGEKRAKPEEKKRAGTAAAVGAGRTSKSARSDTTPKPPRYKSGR